MYAPGRYLTRTNLGNSILQDIQNQILVYHSQTIDLEARCVNMELGGPDALLPGLAVCPNNPRLLSCVRHEAAGN